MSNYAVLSENSTFKGERLASTTSSEYYFSEQVEKIRQYFKQRQAIKITLTAATLSEMTQWIEPVTWKGSKRPTSLVEEKHFLSKGKGFSNY